MKMEAKKCPETVPIPCGTLPLGSGMAINDGFYSKYLLRVDRDLAEHIQ